MFQLSGVGVLGVGIWVKVDKNVVNMQHLVEFDSSDKQLEIAANILIGFGSFVLLISALGFFAACTQKKIFIGAVGGHYPGVQRVSFSFFLSFFFFFSFFLSFFFLSFFLSFFKVSLFLKVSFFHSSDHSVSYDYIRLNLFALFLLLPV